MLIHVSEKIRSTYKKIDFQTSLEEQDSTSENSWNAHLMLLYGKKCWVVTHSNTRYTVIIPDVSVGKIADFRSLFMDCLINQLTIIRPFDVEVLNQFIGHVAFLPTNGDRSCISHINRRIEEIGYWKFDNPHFSDFNFAEIGSNINHLCSKTTEGKSSHIRPNDDFIGLLKL